MGWSLTHPTDGLVYACPECDSAAHVRERADGTVACYDCGSDHDSLDAMVEREDKRGCNLTDEDKQRFTAGSPARYDGPAAEDTPNPQEGNPNLGVDPKYADLTLADVGLEESDD